MSEVGWTQLSDRGSAVRGEAYPTFGAGAELRLYPIPDVGVSVAAEVPFPLLRRSFSGPEGEWEVPFATLLFAAGVVFRVP